MQTMSFRLRTTALLLSSLLVGLPGLAEAGATLPFGDGESLSLGLGLRSSFKSTTDAAPSGHDSSADFSLDSIRIYASATMNPYIKAVFNTERDADGRVRVLDGFAAFELDPAFNIWAGRLLPPSDRANMDGAYYQSAFDYPGVASGFYSLEVGRDDGVVAWGKVADKAVVYSVGAFQGRNHSAAKANSSNQKASLLYAGRVAVNFLDPEPAPAYLEGSTYFGGAHIATVGLAAMSQKDGVGDINTRSDYKAYDIDWLIEQPLGSGSLDFSGAYYKYDYSLAAYAADISGGAGITPPGKAWLVDLAYLFGEKVGVGKFQPFARYQKFDVDGGGSEKTYDIGLHYVIKGADARLSLLYRHDEVTSAAAVSKSSSSMIAGLQLQF